MNCDQIIMITNIGNKYYKFHRTKHYLQGHAHYKFEYGVHDPHTHDHKSQHEYRHGDHVHGGYTLKEADGTHRIVKYTSGPHTGFEALVHRIGHAHHPHHGTSYVGLTHWANQGPAEHGHGY